MRGAFASSGGGPAGHALVGPPYPLTLPLGEGTRGEVLGGARAAPAGLRRRRRRFRQPHLRRSRAPGPRAEPLAAGDYGRERERGFFWHLPYDHPETGYDEAKPTIGVNDFAVSQTRPHSALRAGAGKLLRFHEDDRVECDHLAAAAGEQENRSAREPGRPKALRARLEGERRARGARFPSAAGSLP